jgi:dolichyl-phosphate beta-glucosyltransferase
MVSKGLPCQGKARYGAAPVSAPSPSPTPAGDGGGRLSYSVVVTVFNEEGNVEALATRVLAAMEAVGASFELLFVDDGSSDATGRVLAAMAHASDAIEVFSLDSNTGKAEAVRRGLVVALRSGPGVVGYYDADLATPPEELMRLIRELRSRPELSGVLASRVARLGSSIERNAVRHYVGRTYATIASIALGITVYDTQCGAKVFRVNDTFVAALAEPFRSSWAFDAEMLHRLLRGNAQSPGLAVESFVELPLTAWHDVSGSKMRFGPALAALFDLLRIARRRRRSARPEGNSASVAEAVVMAPHRRRAPGAPSSARGDASGEETGQTRA